MRLTPEQLETLAEIAEKHIVRTGGEKRPVMFELEGVRQIIKAYEGIKEIERIKEFNKTLESKLDKIEENLDQVLSNETNESLSKWLSDKRENQIKTNTIPSVRYIIEFEEGVYYAGWDGDPGRTLKLENAMIFETKRLAEKILERELENNPHRKYKNSKLITVDAGKQITYLQDPE